MHPTGGASEGGGGGGRAGATEGQEGGGDSGRKGEEDAAELQAFEAAREAFRRRTEEWKAEAFGKGLATSQDAKVGGCGGCACRQAARAGAGLWSS